jgi:hypothetical protein
MVGLIAAGFLVAGAGMYFARPDDHNLTTGILVRVGLLLGVIWLAMPQLESMRTKISTVVLLVIVLLLVLVAVRPNLFKVISGVLAISLALNWVLKWVGAFADPPKR